MEWLTFLLERLDKKAHGVKDPSRRVLVLEKHRGTCIEKKKAKKKKA